MDLLRDDGGTVKTRCSRLNGRPRIFGPASKAFQEHQAEGVDIAGRSQGTAEGLLRAEVLGGSHRHSGGSQAATFQYSCHAKIGKFHYAIRAWSFRNQDVGRFYVAVNHSAPVNLHEGTCKGVADVRCFPEAERGPQQAPNADYFRKPVP
ncbi:hypothetical protein StoSoilB13_28840 (plasmid) [Arthrobacter sp. StoSoilB13]|nr:hypothetical protein StoSoilB13_28840 [Arthrobacter sp. StoSoilB13]